MLNSVYTNGRQAATISAIPQSLIGADLEQVERILSQTLAPYRSRFHSLVRHLNHYRGKRLRPTLLLLIAHACGKAVPAHHTLSAVVEMIHTATLGQRGVGQQSQHPARGLAVYECLSSEQHDRRRTCV
jgi:octaprenyl-diphosphate synthase